MLKLVDHMCQFLLPLCFPVTIMRDVAFAANQIEVSDSFTVSANTDLDAHTPGIGTGYTKVIETGHVIVTGKQHPK